MSLGQREMGSRGGNSKILDGLVNRLQKICSVLLQEMRVRVQLCLNFLWLKWRCDPLALLKMLKTSIPLIDDLES